MGNTRLGIAEANSISAFGDQFLEFSHNLFGDPSMIVWTHYIPLKINITTQDNTDQNIPKNFELGQNFPNPFNPATKIVYGIPTDCHVSLKVYDILGKLVETLVDNFENMGYHSIEFNASKLTSGIYFYKITAGNFISTKKMIVIK
jgi:hypothetical protein